MNSGSYGLLLCEFLLDPPPHGRERIKRFLADVDAGEAVAAQRRSLHADPNGPCLGVESGGADPARI